MSILILFRDKLLDTNYKSNCNSLTNNTLKRIKIYFNNSRQLFTKSINTDFSHKLDILTPKAYLMKITCKFVVPLIYNVIYLPKDGKF